MTLKNLVNILLHWISNTNYDTKQFNVQINRSRARNNSRDGVWWKMSSCCFFFKNLGIFLSTKNLMICAPIDTSP